MQPEESVWDEFLFGNDLYAIPEMAAQSSNPVVDIPPASKTDEEDKLRALIETPVFDYSRWDTHIWLTLLFSV